MKKYNKIAITFILIMQGICYAGFAQSGLGTNPCNGGDPNPIEEPTWNPDWNTWVEKDISSEAPKDPNEIIGLDGYDAIGSNDTFRWVAAMQTLAYTVYFENDTELAMAAASKIMITVPLHEKLNFATFGVRSTYSWFSKSFMVASLTCIHDIMLEIPLAHCVRGGMVRFADGRVGKRRAASENVPLPVTSSSPPFFFPFCLLVRNTIPRNVTTLSGISSVWQQTSKKCSLT